ncbi:MAG: hypothetical protein ACYCSN_08830 [Acidobacteriaceae bacterium]
MTPAEATHTVAPFTVNSLVIVGFRSPSLAFARRIREAGVVVHLIDIVHKQTKFQRQSSAIDPDGDVLLWSEVGTDAGVERILQVVRRVGAQAVHTVDEGAQLWLAQHRSRFEPSCRILSPSASMLDALLKKSVQISLARQSGFNLLPNWEVNSLADAEMVAPNAFPVCVRPAEINCVEPMFKAKVFASPADLSSFVSGIRRQTAPLLVQPYTMGPNVVVHGVRSADGRMLDLRAYLAYRKSRGFAVSLRPFDLPAQVRSACIQFAERTNIVGPFHYDLLQSARNGEIYFLEINVRLGGTSGKVMHLGYDEPMLTLRSFGVVTPLTPPPLTGKEFSVTGKRLALAHLFDTICQHGDPLSYPRGSWWADVRDAAWEILSVHDALFTWHDVRGSLWYLLQN